MQLEWDDESKVDASVEQAEGDVDTSKRVNAADKRIINSKTDVNQLVPFKYKWAWDSYLKSCENQWMPQEYIMEQDVAQWNDPEYITSAERQLFIRNISLLVLNDNGAIGSVVLSIYRHITAPEVRQYLLRQGFEEALRPHAYNHVVDALKIDEQMIFDSFNSFAAVQAKKAFVNPYLDLLKNPDFKMGTVEADAQFLKALAVYVCIVKGLFSTVSFSQMLTFGRYQKMTKTFQQYSLMLRDELTHFKAGADIIRAIKIENPELWPTVYNEIATLIRQAVELEYAAAKETLASPVLGMQAEPFLIFLQTIANQRARAIGIGVLFPAAKNPFPWFSEVFGLGKGEAVASTKTVENNTGGTLNWE